MYIVMYKSKKQLMLS